MSTIPSIQQIVSKYLWGQITMPTPNELIDSKWIRPFIFTEDEQPRIKINQYEYMTVGAGRYATVDMFGIFNKFFDAELTQVPVKNYTFSELVSILYASVAESERPTNELALGLSQYQMDIHSADYAQRAYIFGSTSFTANWDEINFIVNEDGSKEIQNLQIYAKEDNFDYESDSGVAWITNLLTEEEIDRSGIGRKVILDFTGDAPVINSLTSTEFYAQKNQNKTIRETYYDRQGDNLGFGNIDLSQITMFYGVINAILDSGITKPKDINGNDIFYVDPSKSLDLKFPNNISGNLVLVGNESSNILEGQAGNNYIYGFGGLDTLKGGFGDDYLFGGLGTDTLYGGVGDDHLYANSLDDFSDTGSNALYGGKGSDYLYGGSESDYLYAGDEINDSEDKSDNFLYGNDGNDYLYGAAGIDYLYGGLGSDKLYGAAGTDHLYAGDKKDDENDTSINYLYGGLGQDYLHGGAGNDYLYAGIEENDSTDIDKNYLFGGAGDDHLYGGSGEDYLNGGDDNDKLNGGSGKDILVGGYGRDILNGGEGDDILYGGLVENKGKDNNDQNELYGGAGDDILRGSGRLEGGEGFDRYNVFGTAVVRDEDGKGILNYEGRHLIGARTSYYSESLTLTKALDFSSSGYLLNNTNQGRAYVIASGENYKVYQVGGNIDFKYQGLETEDLDNKELGIAFYVRVYRDDQPPPPPPFIPPHNPPTQSDPLILDLDHDGKINTVALGVGIYFDLDGNEFAENTSWVAPQDGFVVLDLNDNGTIDNGSELFGTDTLLTDGSKAADGFTALAQYDENQDQVINDQDQIYQQLKIWKDHNQDGVSQADELFTLSDLGISSISVNRQAIDVTDENNVVHTNTATFTQQVLENGILTTKTGLAETLLFQVDTSSTVWQGTIDNEEGIAADILALPNFPGYGSVTSLHTAMANDTTGALKALVSQFATTAPEDQLALTHQILLHWTNKQHISASETTYYTEGMSKQQFEILKALWGKEVEWNGWPPHHQMADELEVHYQKVLASAYSQLMSQTTERDWIDLVIFKEEKVYEHEIILPGGPNGSGGGRTKVRMSVYGDELPPPTGGTPWQYIYSIWHGDFSLAIEQLTSLFFMDHTIGKAEIEKFHLIVSGLDPNSAVLYKELLEQFTFKSQEIMDEEIRDLLLESVYVQNDDLVGTEQNDTIKSFGGDDQIKAQAGDDIVYGGIGNDTIYGGVGNDYLDGGMDDDKLYGDNGDDILTGGTGDDYLDGGAGNDIYIFSLGDGQDTIQSAENNVNKLDRIVFNEGINAEDVNLKRQGNDLLVKYSESDQITVKNYFDSNGATAYRVDQIIFADETVWDVDYIKQQVLVPTESNDTIQGYNSADQLSGLAGNDSLYGYAGHDTLIGGTGNDYLDGGIGNDTYIFSLGDGQDTIQSSENNVNKLDRIVFNEGINAEDVNLKRQGNDLLVKYSEQDQITVKNYFDSNGATAYRVDQIIFADETVWDVEYIKTEVLEATTSNDVIQGYSSADQLQGLAGNDTLYGHAGHDTLIGGTGNDYLDGGIGNDTYIFSLGDGQDTIQSSENNVNKLDRIVFNEGINAEDVNLKRQGNDLLVKYSEQDQITVKNYFDSNGATAYRVDQIVFADDTIWDVEYIKTKVLEATTSNDVIQGYSSADQLQGLAGNDTLYGHAGHDTLIGGTGNDYLDGGTGNDTYIFSLGDGQDTIQSSENNVNKLDRIVFNEGINAEDVNLKRQGNDLLAKYSEQDQITVKNYFDSNGATAYRVDQIVFADDTIWEIEIIKTKVLAATESNDTIQGYNSADQLSGLAGNDSLYGHAGNDILIGGTGNDYLDGGTGNDTYIFSLGDGQDTIQSSENNTNKLDRIVFNEGISTDNVTLLRQGNDLLVKYSEQDQITVKNYFNTNGATAYRIDQIVFADNTVWDVESIKIKVLAATVANDVINGYDSADQLSGLAGNDSLYGHAGNDTLIGGTGNDYLDGGSGNDTYVFAPYFGHDIIRNYDNTANRQDIIQFTDGLLQSNFTFRRSNDDLVIRTLDGESSITVQNYFQSDALGHYRIDQIRFSDNTLLDVEAVKALVLLGTAQSDILQAYATGSTISGEVGNDVIHGNIGSDQLYGGDGLDQLYGGAGDDHLEGGEDNDHLVAGAGNDILIGGTGNDQLVGGEGNDTYVFAPYFGHDIINNFDNTSNRLDIIQFDGLVQSDFTFRRNNNDLVIRTLDGENSITVQNYFQSDALGHYRIDQIRFSDNTVLNVDAVKALVLLGTSEADTLIAYETGSIISGEAGDDVIHGNIGADELYGGDGLDKLYGGAGNDHLDGGSGDDQFYGGIGNDILIGGTGNDRLEGGDGNDNLQGDAGDDILIAGSGNDILTGGTGNDELTGGAGNDTYLFSSNFGHDIIKNYDNSENRQDVIQFIDGLVQSDFTFRRYNDDLVLRTLDGEHSVTVQNYFQSDAFGYYRVDQIQFSDNTVLDVEAVKALVLIGTDDADILRAYATGSTISGEAGDDVIHGNSGVDELYGGDGADQLYGGDSDDYLDGGADNDQLYGGAGHDVLIGGTGNDRLEGGEGNDNLQGDAGNDILIAGSGDDILTGGTGNDELTGGAGNDTYIFAPDFGHDIINNFDSTANRQDVIQFTDGLVQSDFTFRRDNNNLVIRTLNGENSIIVQNYFESDALGNYRIDEIQFSDNTILDVEAVKALVLVGTDDADILRAYATGSTISGEAGDDVIYGHTGSDQLYGGDGLDQLYGGNSNDHLDGGADDDQLYGGAGDDVLIGGTGNDLLDAGDGADQLYGGTGNDVLNGGAGNDLLEGGTGSDQLNGGTGDDILVGGSGDDLLIGGQGSDIYRFDLGWGQDTIQYESKNQTDADVIEFININPDELIVRKVGQDMVIVHRITGDQLLVESQFSDYLSNKPINIIRFDDQTEWNEAAIKVQAVKGTELNDIIEGTTDSDVIHAGDGDDIIYGSPVYSDAPETQYFVYGGDGDDKIYASGYLDGGAGDDEIEGSGHLLGGEGNDILTGQGVLEGQAGNDIILGQGELYGGDGQDHLTLTSLADDESGLLSGGSGDDTLIVDVNRRHFVDANNQNDFTHNEDGYHLIQDSELTEAQRAVYVEGGQGNDTIYGSFGDEVYLFNLGDGQDTIIERPAGQNYSNVAVSFDVLRFGQNIDVADITLHRYGTDLVVKYSNNTDQITIQNYFVGGHHKVNEVQFADSTVWDNAYIENHVTYHGTSDHDEVWGYRNTHETFMMGDGDDKVYSGAGNDIIYGQAGNDTLWGQAGDDTLYGGVGEDYLEGNEGDDILHGDQGNDILYGGDGNDTLYGGDGDDTLRGGAGHDILNGGAGHDKYFYYLTDGTETIDQTGGGTDVLWLMDYGITRDRISFSKENNDLIVTIDNNANQSIRVVDHFLGGEKAISTVQANGEVGISSTEIANIIKAQAYGGLYDIVLEGTNSGETIYGTTGKDLILGLEGNDTIWAQAGNDRIEGDAGNDYLDGGAGDDHIYGGSGHDTLIGGAGNDYLDGGAGDDKYFYYLADGVDIIDQTGGGTDVLWLMDQGITEDRINFTRENNDLIITIDHNSNQSVRVKDHFLGGEKAIAAVQPNGGYSISAAQIAVKVNSSSGGETPPEPEIPTEPETPNVAGDTTYDYTTGDLTITEQSGNDKVIFKNGISFSQVGNYLTKSGDDLILKVNGSHTNKVTVKSFFLGGQYLVETFQFETGGQITAEQIFGAFGLTIPTTPEPGTPTEPETPNVAGDTTYDYTTGDLSITEQSGNDTVIFKNGISFSQVGNYLTKSGDDLILKVNGSNTNKVTVKNFFLGGQYLVETFQFETGGQITAEQIFGAFGLTMPEPEPEIPSPEPTALETFDSTYTYTSGAMLITEDLGTDQVVFGNGITFSQVGSYLTKSGDDLILKVGGSNSNKVTVKDFFLGGAHEVESFSFETGGSISSGQIYGAFGIQRPLNAEDFSDQVIVGEDQQVDTVTSLADQSEIFALGEGTDVVELTQLNTGEAEIDYWTDFDVQEDKIDLSSLLNEVLTSSNIGNFVSVDYDAGLKTNTISIKTQSTDVFSEMLVLTNQSEQLVLQDLMQNQSFIY